ncbi:MAG: hypothetical protein NC307_04210 [Roseburia sp.]|nr:hypothetical protein [Roseburia sp.]
MMFVDFSFPGIIINLNTECGLPVEFVFSDGTTVEWQSRYAYYEVTAAQCLDVTGDGVKELLL